MAVLLWVSALFASIAFASASTLSTGASTYPLPQADSSFASTGCGQTLPDGITAGVTSTVNVTYDGVARAYNIHVPVSYDKDKAAPLILAYHGRGMPISELEADSNLTVADWNPYGIVMFPYGLDASLIPGAKTTDLTLLQDEWEGDPATLLAPRDDQGFSMSLINSAENDYCIDTSRIWAAGMSNGGGFVNIMACNATMNTRISAFGMHSGAFYTNTTDADCDPLTVVADSLISGSCVPGRDVPVVELHGINDTTIPYEGGPRRGWCLPAIQSDWLGKWATRDDQLGSAVGKSLVAGAQLFAYGDGSVSHVGIADWGHVWASKELGAPLDATPLMMQFFYDWSGSSAASSTSSATVTATTSTTAAATTTMTSGASKRMKAPFFLGLNL